MMVDIPLVRRGEDEYLLPDRETGEPRHTVFNVYAEMLVQVMRDFASLPDPRTLTLGEIAFLYESLRRELRDATAPKKTV